MRERDIYIYQVQTFHRETVQPPNIPFGSCFVTGSLILGIEPIIALHSDTDQSAAMMTMVPAIYMFLSMGLSRSSPQRRCGAWL
jgi:hypothetical protein